MTWGIDLESTAMVAMDRHAEMRAYARQQHELKAGPGTAVTGGPASGSGCDGP